jgi:hypothetical protein
LKDSSPDQILASIKEYEVDVVEVVGHTDEQPVGSCSSNLDRDLIPVLKDNAAITSLVPADNPGLGLARATSVVSRSAKPEARRVQADSAFRRTIGQCG